MHSRSFIHSLAHQLTHLNFNSHTNARTHLQITKCSFSMAYNMRQGYEYTSYGEVINVLVADVVLMALILFYTGRKAALIAFLVGGR